MAQPHFAASRSDTLTASEISAMASVLARRYAGRSVEVALHFAAEHDAVEDEARAAVWRRVAGLLQARFSTPTLS